ncbi:MULTISPECIES: hypothetical protein [unclassified Nostoc]|nr:MULTISPECIES: hypothetical protein [unclassified Nostoc]
MTRNVPVKLLSWEQYLIYMTSGDGTENSRPAGIVKCDRTPC